MQAVRLTPLQSKGKDHLLRSPISRALLLAGACLLAIAPFFWWGSPSGHDFEFHVFSWMEVLGQWKHGIAYPRWAALAHWGYGEARFLFYPPASWTLGAALGAILPWAIVPGTYCWIALTLAGAAMYRLAREWLSVPDALFAAVFYALNPYHLLIVYWRSAYAELLAAPLSPLVFLCLIKLQEPAVDRETYKPDFRPTLWLSLLLAAAWLTNAPAAMMIHYSTAGLALLLAVCAAVRNRSLSNLSISRRWGPQIWRPLLRMALAIVFGIGLASFYLLPTIYEQKWIDINQVMSPGVRPQDNFLFTKLADPDHNRFNLLVSSVAAVEIAALALAIWASRRWRSKRPGIVSLKSSTTLSSPIAGSNGAVAAVPNNNNDDSHDDNVDARRLWVLLSAWGMGSALLMLSLSNFFWQHLPKFRFVQLPFRWLLCMNAALAMLLTVATKRWTLRLLAFGILLAALIVAGYRIQPPWWDTGDDIHEMSDAVTDGTGYEGTDEYVPAGADAYELNKSLPLVSDVSDDSGAAVVPVRSEILTWGPTEKHFIVHAAAAQDITVRLFSYPAWQVVVNGNPTATEKTELTGVIVIPVAAGDSDVRIYFRRTIDRLVGDIVSLISLLVFVIVWFKVAYKPAWDTRSRLTLRPENHASHIS
jgi:hypothetical protein